MSNKVHIIGPFNTGTNLLHNIIKKCNCIDLNTNKPVIVEGQHNPFSKHTIKIKQIYDYISNKNNLLIIMYKNVYNWLYSIQKSPYDAKFTKLYSSVELFSKTFPNMIEVYNFYYTNYLSILNQFDNVIFLNYEEIINKSTSYDYLNAKLQKINLRVLSKDDYYLELSKPAKTHGTSVSCAAEAKNQFKKNNDIVKRFVQKIPSFNKSIKTKLIDFFENN